eukprot:290497-Pelagomonas_calceolata.AAC.2
MQAFNRLKEKLRRAGAACQITTLFFFTYEDGHHCLTLPNFCGPAGAFRAQLMQVCSFCAFGTILIKSSGERCPHVLVAVREKESTMC